MREAVEEALQKVPMFRRLSGEDRKRFSEVSRLQTFARRDPLFHEGDSSQTLYAVVSGRVKVVKSTPSGSEVILGFFGPGDPIGGAAAFESRPYPAAAVAVEETVCILTPRDAFFALLDHHPTLVRGLLSGLTLRLIELTERIAELSGGRIEPRMARLFLKMADEKGVQVAEGIFIPTPLSRQEIADLCGTTIETAIRVMSRWGKDAALRTEREGFTLLDRPALEELAGL